MSAITSSAVNVLSPFRSGMIFERKLSFQLANICAVGNAAEAITGRRKDDMESQIIFEMAESLPSVLFRFAVAWRFWL